MVPPEYILLAEWSISLLTVLQQSMVSSHQLKPRVQSIGSGLQPDRVLPSAGASTTGAGAEGSSLTPWLHCFSHSFSYCSSTQCGLSVLPAVTLPVH